MPSRLRTGGGVVHRSGEMIADRCLHGPPGRDGPSSRAGRACNRSRRPRSSPKFLDRPVGRHEAGRRRFGADLHRVTSSPSPPQRVKPSRSRSNSIRAPRTPASVTRLPSSRQREPPGCGRFSGPRATNAEPSVSAYATCPVGARARQVRTRSDSRAGNGPPDHRATVVAEVSLQASPRLGAQ